MTINFKCTIYILALACILSVGCAHPITHKTNVSTQIGYSGNAHNGGILRIDPSGGRVVGDDVREAYNELIGMYGDQFEPDLKPDAGMVNLKPNEWLIDKEHWIKALQMRQWRRDGRQPTGTFTKLVNKVL